MKTQRPHRDADAPPSPLWCQAHEKVKHKSLSEVADAWLVSYRHQWAIEERAGRCYRKPGTAWWFIKYLIQRADTEELLGHIGAGPLEDFVRAYAPEYIDRIESLARRNERFRRALQGVWFEGAKDALTQRLCKLGCYDLNSRPVSKESGAKPRKRRRKQRHA